MPIDYKEYGVQFAVKSQVLRMYGKCAQCGAQQAKAHPRTRSRVVLTVHHLDRNPRNHLLGNLVPLCQACHLNEHRLNLKQGYSGVQVSVDYLAWVDGLLSFFKYLVEEMSVNYTKLHEITKGQQGSGQER